MTITLELRHLAIVCVYCAVILPAFLSLTLIDFVLGQLALSEIHLGHSGSATQNSPPISSIFCVLHICQENVKYSNII